MVPCITTVVSSTIKMPLSNGGLFLEVQKCDFKFDLSLLTYALESSETSSELPSLSDKDVDALSSLIINFIKVAIKKWKDVNQSVPRLKKKYDTWFSSTIDLSFLTPLPKISSSSSTSAGRPSKEFSDLTKRSRDRSTSHLRSENEADKLIHAATVAVKGINNDAAFVFQETVKTPTHASKLRRLSGIADAMTEVPSKPVSLPTKMSSEAGLAHLLENNWTKDSYINTHLLSKECNADIWPTYDNVLEAKTQCRPDGIDYQEMAVIVPIEERLKHNDRRFIILCKEQITNLLDQVEDGGKLVIEAESKVGFDGSTGLSIYNQGFSLQNEDVNESSMLSTCLVPLQYRVKEGEPVFTNPVPQACSFCQPLRLEFRKETPQASKEINEYIDEAIARMKENPHVVQVGNKKVEFIHILWKTMLDVKSKNALTETASAVTCFVCKANPSQFNDLTNFPDKFPTKPENLQYGTVCPLHVELRAFDGVNSVSDRLTVKQWRIPKGNGSKRRGESDEKAKERLSRESQVAEKRRKERQKKFKDILKLVVNMPRAGGSGNSNTGNVARRAFQDEEKFSQITGVDKELIQRLHVLIIALNTHHEIDSSAFCEYGRQTAALWKPLYPWFPMPASVHQLCIHGHESIKHCTLPISFYTEQVSFTIKPPKLIIDFMKIFAG